MRCVCWMFLLTSFGCFGQPTPTPKPEAPKYTGPPVEKIKTGATKAGTDWPRFLGPTGDSKSTEKGIIAPWPEEGLPILWHKKVGDGYAMPSIADGKLYHFDRERDEARVTCMDAVTGKQIWQFKYETNYRDQYNYSGGPRCYPILDGDRVYTYGPDGQLHCLDTKKGKPIWDVDTTKKYGVIQNFFGVGSTPVIEGNLLIAQVGGSPKGSEEEDFARLKGNGSAVVAFNKMTGKEVWKASKELASYAGPVLATINKKRWCFVFARGGLLGLDPKNGKIEFHFPWRARAFESVNASTPVVVDDKIFISETYGPGSAFLKIEDGKPKVIWDDKANFRKKAMQCHWSTPIHIDGYLYGCSKRHEEEAELRCIELKTGKVMWSKPGLSRTSLLHIDGHLICLGERGIVRLLKVNPNRYEEISTMTIREPDAKGVQKLDGTILLEYPCWAAPLVSHGLMYVKGQGHLVCLQLIPKK